jgi:hypothetical protein
MAANRVDLRDECDVGALVECLDRGAHTGATGTDDEHVVRCFHYRWTLSDGACVTLRNNGHHLRPSGSDRSRLRWGSTLALQHGPSLWTSHVGSESMRQRGCSTRSGTARSRSNRGGRRASADSAADESGRHAECECEGPEEDARRDHLTSVAVRIKRGEVDDPSDGSTVAAPTPTGQLGRETMLAPTPTSPRPRRFAAQAEKASSRLAAVGPAPGSRDARAA